MPFTTQRKRVLGPMPSNYISSSYARWQTKIRKTSIYFVPVIILSILIFSVMISAFHAPDVLILSHECPLCKLVLDFSFGTGITACSLTTPDFVRISIIPERLILIIELLVIVLGTRAPPLSFRLIA
jgi:hypothetical protein